MSDVEPNIKIVSKACMPHDTLECLILNLTMGWHLRLGYSMRFFHETSIFKIIKIHKHIVQFVFGHWNVRFWRFYTGSIGSYCKHLATVEILEALYAQCSTIAIIFGIPESIYRNRTSLSSAAAVVVLLVEHPLYLPLQHFSLPPSPQFFQGSQCSSTLHRRTVV